MPFAYFGAKHGLARKYPPPAFETIIEPFAGSAGYATFYATPRTNVILIEKDPAVVALWREVQTLTADSLAAIDRELTKDRSTHPLICVLAGGDQLRVALEGGSIRVNSHMKQAWPTVRRRIVATLPLVRQWTIIEGDYTEAPDLRATWFIDPPYQPKISPAGNIYKTGSAGLDYAALADWCRARRGQVIVCEQEPAAWLPFRPLAKQRSQRTTEIRTEVVWSRSPGRVLGTPNSASTKARSAARRSAIRSTKEH